MWSQGGYLVVYPELWSIAQTGTILINSDGDEKRYAKFFLNLDSSGRFAGDYR
ncbi:hypothetical protein [Microcoleus sp. PH2017_02_FOX_O_A]|uniref:hypothetical protein n=1 Tax=Microcoleus sp. PH2017_02_FOX_O_A TaxID=2798813 RepID=UPI0025FDD500|nr:hypothetical protein [Microcoleus sp. PH2017_02_FOX_O_A]